MFGPIYFGPDGEPITVEQFSAMLQSEERFVAQDRVGDKIVSTVWLGLDLGFGFDHRNPLIFETMVFYTTAGGDLDPQRPIDAYTQRYARRDEALDGHRELTKFLPILSHPETGRMATETTDTPKRDD